MGERRALGDLIPGGPYQTGPELRCDGLVCRASRARVLTQALDFVQGLSVSGARERWGRRWPELVGLLQHKGVTLAHCVKTAGEKVGGVGR